MKYNFRKIQPKSRKSDPELLMVLVGKDTTVTPPIQQKNKGNNNIFLFTIIIRFHLVRMNKIVIII